MPRPKTREPSLFNRRLVELRRDLHLTQEELAEQLGVSRGTVAYLEAKADNPSLATVEKLAEFFQVSPLEFMEEPEPEQPRRGPTPKLDQQIARVKELSAYKQRMVVRLLDAFLRAEGKATS